MRIVDLNKLSEEEKKKILEEQQARINQRMQENEVRQSQSNQQFNNLISNTGEYNTNKHTFNKSSITKPTVWDKVNYTISKLSGGMLSGTTGVTQSGILDIANNLKKGKERNTKTDIAKSIYGRVNPAQIFYNNNLISYIKDTVNNITDKNKTGMEKLINQGINTSNYMYNNMSGKHLADSGIQMIGKILPNMDKTLMKVNDKISGPSNNYNQFLAEESKKVDGVTFIWFTDGLGWKSARKNLEETFNELPTLYSINDLDQGVLEHLK